MSSNFNNAKIINVYYNKGDRKPYDVNGKPIAYIGEEAIGATEATTIRFYLGEDLDSSTAVIVTKRPDGERRLDLCEKIGTGVNSYYQVTLNSWYGAVKGKATLAFKVYNGEVEFDDEETPTEIISVEGRIVVSDIFNLEIAYAPEADLIVPADDTPDYVEWFAALSTKLDKAQSITVTGALPTLTGDVYDDRYFYVENEGVGRLYYINGSTAIEVVWQVGTLKLTPTGNGNNTADTGKLSWNQPNGTVNVGLYNDVNIGVGEDVIYYVKATGAITKGDVIQYAGFQGDHALAKRAVQAEINANPKLIMGIAKQNIANGDFGYVAHFGKLEGVDTKSQAVNSFVWFDSAGSTAGNWTITQPTAPNAKILLAVIIKAESSAEANNGVILVRPTIEPKVSELQDINITSIANGQVLRWNATNSRWENTGALTTAESNITNLQGRMTTEEANVDNLQGRMTSAEGDIDDIESGATIVPRALGDQNGNTINTTYLTQSSASATYIPLSQKAQANGVATLGADGRVVASQIPGVVTSIEEYDSLEDFPETGFLTVVYLAMDTGLTYLWSGTQYVIISSSLALGESSTTAYRGDRGKIAYDYSQVGHLPLAGGTVTGNLVVGGDLTISGTTTTINTETVGIKDNLILINSNQTGTPSTALKGGLEIERGDLTNFQFVFDENDDRFKVGQVGSLQTVATRTDDGTIANRGITYFNTSTNRLENNANVVIDTDNNVGIGTSTPNSKLGVNGNLNIISGYLTFNNGDIEIAKVTTGAGAGASFKTWNGTLLTEKMRITGDGSVGIGTASPDQKVTIVTSSGSNYTKTTNGTATVFSGVEPSNLGLFGTTSNHSTIFITNDSERMRITSAGNVGIGTTSPLSKLTVNGDIAIPYGSSIKAYNNSNDTFYTNSEVLKTFYDGGTDNDVTSISSPGGINSHLRFLTGIAGARTERVRINASGNVGIGTTSPNQKLEVNGNTGQPATSGTTQNGLLRLRAGTGSNQYGEALDFGYHVGVSGPATYAWIQATNADGLNTNERLALNPNGGNVGIGTTSPGQKLTINGASSDPSLTANASAIANFVPGTVGTQLVVGGSSSSPFTIWLQNRHASIDGLSYPISLNPLGANVGVGTDNPQYTLDVNGSVAGNSAYVNKSDARLKQNIETITNGLDMVMKLRPVQYKWKKHPTLNFDLETTELGFTAQEVQQALAGTDYVNSVVQSTDVVIEPAKYEEIIKENGTKEQKLISKEVKQKYFNLAESKLVAILTKAIQELTKRVEELESK